MLKAIHKDSGKLISSFKLIKDLSWAGRSKEKFIAPSYEIGNWIELKKKGITEVEVIYVNPYFKNDEKEYVSGHFRIKTEGAVENICNESEEHKLAKEILYQRILDDEIKIINFDNKKISFFADIEDISIEERVGRKKADVLVDFKEIHPVLGRGISFEVQISPQNEKKTFERTYSRSAQGYSIVWLWGDELQDFNNFVEVIPFTEAIELHKRSIEKSSAFFLGDISQKADVKTYEIKKEIQNELEKMSVEFSKKNQELKHNLEMVLSQLRSVGDSMIFEKAKEQIEKSDILPKLNSLIDDLGKKYFEEKIKNNLDLSLNKIIEEQVLRSLPKMEIPEKVYQEFTKRIEEELLKLNFEQFTKDNLIACFKCKKCDSLVPINCVLWEHSSDSTFRNPICFKCNSNKKEVKPGDRKGWI
jgi:hypothetical protein